MTEPLPTCDPTKPTALSPWPHDYEEIGEEHASLAQGGSYVILRCRRCGRRSYRPMAD